MGAEDTRNMHDEIVLCGEHLVKGFGEGDKRTVAINDVSVCFNAGEMTLLMGPSGSGKTTLMAVLSGLLRPESGRVLTLGEDIWAMTDEQREQFRLKHCGFIFQGYNLFTALTAREQIEMVLRWGEGASLKEAQARTDEVLALLDLTKQAHLRPGALSGGQKQRVAIGRALIKNPHLIFADEPTSALDWAHGEEVVKLLQSAARDRGATVLVVAHDARLVPYADKVLVMEDGRMREDDKPTKRPAVHARLYAHPDLPG